MPKKIVSDKQAEKARKKLGSLISKLRSSGTNQLTQRDLAIQAEIPASYLCHMENGTLTPTAEHYAALVRVLKPNESDRLRMDKQYMEARKVPPPDICERFRQNPEFIAVFRNVPDQLTPEQQRKLQDLVNSFGSESEKGVNQDE